MYKIITSVLMIFIFPDSPVSVSREIKFFFPQFDMNGWYERDEPLFRKGMCYFNEKEFTHHVINSSLSSSST